MNIEINHIKDNIHQLEKRVIDLEQIILHLKSNDTKYFYIEYKLDYFEPIDIQKLVEDIYTTLPFEQVYTITEEVKNSTYDSPLLKISLYHITIKLWFIMHKNTDISSWETYFKNKFGTASICPIQDWIQFKKEMEQKTLNVYKDIQGKVTSIL